MSRLDRIRERMRCEVPRNYTFTTHMLKLACLMLLPLPALIVLLIGCDMSMVTWLAVPLGLLLGNLIEYVTHRYPMHRYIMGGIMYKRHAGKHHVMFRHDMMTMTDPRDAYYVMMPALPAAMFMVVIGIITALVTWANVTAFGIVMCITLCVYIFTEELLHLSFHTESTWKNDGVWYSLLRHLGSNHRQHHDPKQMRTSAFNVTFPLFDWLFGTLPKKN